MRSLNNPAAFNRQAKWQTLRGQQRSEGHGLALIIVSIWSSTSWIKWVQTKVFVREALAELYFADSHRQYNVCQNKHHGGQKNRTLKSHISKCRGRLEWLFAQWYLQRWHAVGLQLKNEWYSSKTILYWFYWYFKIQKCILYFWEYLG